MKAEGYKGRKGADFNVMLVIRILNKENFYRGYYNYGGIESVGTVTFIENNMCLDIAIILEIFLLRHLL